MDTSKETKKLYCYSLRFRNALVDNGFKIIDEGVNYKTNKHYWVFNGTDELNYYKDNLYQLERDLY